VPGAAGAEEAWVGVAFLGAAEVRVAAGLLAHGDAMTRRKLLASLDKKRVEAAICEAERLCAAELRVSIAGAFWGDPQKLAERAFRRMGMGATRHLNGILIVVAPWHRKVVVFADQGILAKIDASIWSAAVATVTSVFRDGQFTHGLVTVIEGLGRALAPHFPPAPRSNELSNTVER
jgi:TLP18.3/Psb32/MOLO-1 phosphatase superfamily protein